MSGDERRFGRETERPASMRLHLDPRGRLFIENASPDLLETLRAADWRERPTEIPIGVVEWTPR